MPMNSEQRAMAVRALRAAADKLEEGGDVGVYTYCPDDGYDDGCSDLDLKADVYLNDEWHPDVESVEWGVMVPVEALRPTEITEVCPKHNRYDYWSAYSQVCLDRYKRPEPRVEECMECSVEEGEE